MALAKQIHLHTGIYYKRAGFVFAVVQIQRMDNLFNVKVNVPDAEVILCSGRRQQIEHLDNLANTIRMSHNQSHGLFFA